MIILNGGILIAKTTIQVRVDDQMKTEIEALLDSLGLDTSTAIRMFFKAMLEMEGIPFAIQRKREPDDFDRLRPEYQQAVMDVRLRRNLLGPFETAEEAVAAMLED